MNKANSPSVSVVLPIYNSEAFLERCLDSLVNQTLKNIEILAVNNGSTDNSMFILEKYQKRYSDIIKIITIPHHDRAGAGRNIGIKNANSEYVGFCDSDDYMELNALENLYNTAVENDSDMVYSPFYHVTNNSIKTVFRLNDVSIENILVAGNYALWNKLYKKTLLEKAGEMPTDFSFEDFAYYPIVVSNAQSISYCDHPTYYYVCREGSEVNACSSIRMLDPLKAVDYACAHINPKYRNIFCFSGVQRLVNSTPERWIYLDSYVQYFKSHFAEYQNISAFYSNNSLIPKIQEYIEEFDGAFDNIVYISGFGDVNNDFETYVSKYAFYDGLKVFVLNENNCNISENAVIEKAYNAKNYSLVARYFALSKIKYSGGIFLDQTMLIDAPFNYLKKTKSFWGFCSKTEFTDNIFGGRIGEPIYDDLLNTFREDYILGSFAPFCDRIKNILCGKYNVPLLGLTNIRKYPMTIFSPDVFQYDLRGIESQTKSAVHFTHQKADCLIENGDPIVVDKETLNLFVSKIINNNRPCKDNRLASENIRLSNELKAIKTSTSWSFIQNCKRYSNNVLFKFVKKVYLGLIKRKGKKR